jgi:hypothetical protein
MIKDVIMDDNQEEGRIAEGNQRHAKDCFLGASAVRMAGCNHLDALDCYPDTPPSASRTDVPV